MTTAAPLRALLDTSVFVAAEQGRPRAAVPAGRVAISVFTLAELRLGVLLAGDPIVQARRLRTFSLAERTFESLPITVEIADAFAEITAGARRNGRRPGAMDTWIAATAVAHGVPLYTQDGDFEGLQGLMVVRV